MTTTVETKLKNDTAGQADVLEQTDVPDNDRNWQLLGRVRSQHGELPRITAIVDLDSGQSDWVRQESRRTNLSPIDLIKRLIDRERVAPGGSSEGSGA